jgi:hypothetical protein
VAVIDTLRSLAPIHERWASSGAEKIKGLSRDSATKAKAKFAQFKSAAPGKWKSLTDDLAKEFDELKEL